jgi:dGTP triphosphohydrolase
MAVENSIANFNVSISSEDIKKLAMEMAKELLENDTALQTMIDHLQIDFQNEAMKELEEIKNQLKEAVRQQADVMIKQEIEKIIKDELKDYVEKITAKIVRERLNAIFRENE